MRVQWIAGDHAASVHDVRPRTRSVRSGENRVPVFLHHEQRAFHGLRGVRRPAQRDPAIRIDAGSLNAAVSVDVEAGQISRIYIVPTQTKPASTGSSHSAGP